MKPNEILVSFIIVTYNSEKQIESCLQSIQKNFTGSFEIIIVDNNSTDETVAVIEKDFLDKVTLLNQTENLGFGKANNIGIKKALGEFVFLLNPDTQILDASINKLFDFYKDNVGIIAPQLVDHNQKPIPTVRKLPTLMGAIEEYVFNRKGKYNFFLPLGDDISEVECVVGAAMLIRKDFFVKIGLFDEKYFLYYEDTELCRRVRLVGKRIVYIPQVKVFHEVGSSSKSNPKSQSLNKESSLIYHGFLGYIGLQIIFTLVRIKNKLSH